MSDMNNPADDNNGAMDDLWAEAFERTKNQPVAKALPTRCSSNLAVVMSAERCRIST